MPDLPAPTLPPDPDVAAGVVTFTVDAQAEPGDVVPALAGLLIGVWRRRREAEQDPKPQTTEV